MSLGSPFGTRTSRLPSRRQCGQGGSHRRRLRRQLGPEPVHRRLPGNGDRRRSASPRTIPSHRSPGYTLSLSSRDRRTRSRASTRTARPTCRPRTQYTIGGSTTTRGPRRSTSRSAATRRTSRLPRTRHRWSSSSAAFVPAWRRPSSASRPVAAAADGELHRRLPAVRGSDHLQPRHRYPLHRDHPVPRRAVEFRRTTPTSAADGSAPPRLSRPDNTSAEPEFLGPASFTSGGPRSGDSMLKPMSPHPASASSRPASARETLRRDLRHVDGRSAHRRHCGSGPTGASGLGRDQWKAAIVNTGDPAGIAGATVQDASRRHGPDPAVPGCDDTGRRVRRQQGAARELRLLRTTDNFTQRGRSACGTRVVARDLHRGDVEREWRPAHAHSVEDVRDGAGGGFARCTSR